MEELGAIQNVILFRKFTKGNQNQSVQQKAKNMYKKNVLKPISYFITKKTQKNIMLGRYKNMRYTKIQRKSDQTITAEKIVKRENLNRHNEEK